MERVSFEEHDFEKTNLVTIRTRMNCYDTYVCRKCGLKGKRYGLSDFISVNKNRKCNA